MCDENAQAGYIVDPPTISTHKTINEANNVMYPGLQLVLSDQL